MSQNEFDISIVGAGATGLSAAIEGAERGARVACIEQATLPGGLIANVGRIDGFAIAGEISGAQLIGRLGERCRELDVQMLQADVTAMQRKGARHVLATSAGPVQSSVVLAASGARLRQLGVPGEAEFAGRGVSQCDWCDGGFFRDESVLVVGGGDAAFQAALHLAGICASVTLVMRGSVMRARRAYVQQAAENSRIAFLWDTVVERIEGDDRVRRAVLRDNAENRTYEQAADGIFVFAGLEPNAAFLPSEVERDAKGFAITGSNWQTALPGVFAAGAVRSGYRGQLVSACGEGAAAGAAAFGMFERITS
jgi:thioredoxin reductase (NADPH)